MSPVKLALQLDPHKNDHQRSLKSFFGCCFSSFLSRCLSKNLFTTSRKRLRPLFRMTVLEFFNVFNLFYKQPPDIMVWSLGSLYVLRYLQYEKNLSIHVVQKQHGITYFVTWKSPPIHSLQKDVFGLLL